MSYTIRQEGFGRYEEKKSLFLGRIKPVKTEEEARQYIEEIKKIERGARHHVFCYRLGDPNPTVRFSDDGEPQGTGGAVLLGILEKKALTDVCLVVSRHFGGVLLGASGLGRAYGKAAAAAVADSPVWRVTQGVKLRLELAYDVHAKLTNLLQGIQVKDSWYGEAVSLDIVCNLQDLEGLKAELTEASAGQVKFISEEIGDYFISESGDLESLGESLNS